MLTLDDLEDLQHKIRETFYENFQDIDEYEEVLKGNDLLFSQQIFKVRKENRVFQVNINKKSRPNAFIKDSGVNFETELLQIILNNIDINLQPVHHIFENWIVRQNKSSLVRIMLEKFNSTYGY